MVSRWNSPAEPVAFAQPFTIAQTEITYLLDFVEISGCEFYRNGSWYDSVQAQKHLHTKFDYLSARNRIETAEDFIEQGGIEKQPEWPRLRSPMW